MYLPQLNITRFVAALSIVVIHFGLYTWPIDTPLLFPIATKALSAVSYFFVLSGFILVISSIKDNSLPPSVNTRTFWINRCARIIPVYLFAIIVFFAIHFHYSPDIPLKWQIQSYIYSLFFLQSWHYAMALDVNFPAWTLSVEAFFYFVFPWLYWQLNYCKSKGLIYIIGIAWIANSYLFKTLLDAEVPHHFVYYFPLLHVATFLMGIAAGILFVRHHELLAQKTKELWIATIASTSFLLYAAYTNMSFFEYQHNGLLTPYFILVIYTLSVSKGKVATLFASKPFVFAGDISYALYILQVPVLDALTTYIPAFQGKEHKDFFYYYVLILIASSAFIYLVLEKPCRAFIKKMV